MPFRLTEHATDDSPGPSVSETGSAAHGFSVRLDEVDYTHPGGVSVLHKVSLQFAPKTMCAVIGPSGCGKSTLLNVLAGRLAATSGHVRVRSEGVAVLLDSLADERPMAYVMQEDVLPPAVTPREYLAEQAVLRMPESTSQREMNSRIDCLIHTLGLIACAHQTIGGESRLSSGERKRVAVAAELLSNPRLLLLDEPTTGLDNQSAEDVMSHLRKHLVEDQGRTVIASIHLPSAQVFSLFTHVVLLSQDGVLYSGQIECVDRYFAAQGHHRPAHLETAEFLLRLAQGLPGARAAELEDPWGQSCDLASPRAEKEDRSRVTQLAEAWKEHEYCRSERDWASSSRYVVDECVELLCSESDALRKELTTDEIQSALRGIGCELSEAQMASLLKQITGGKSSVVTRRMLASHLHTKGHARPWGLEDQKVVQSKPRVSVSAQLRVLLTRHARSHVRDPAQLKASMAQVLFNSILIGVCFWGAEGVRQVRGLLSLVVSAAASIGNQQLSVLQSEQRMVLREHASGLYYPAVHFLAKTLVSLPSTAVAAALLPVPVYFTSGLYEGPGMRLDTFFAVMLLSAVCASSMEGLALVFGTLPMKFDSQRLLHSCLDGPFKVLNGYFVSRPTLPVFLAWLYAASPYALSYEAATKALMTGRCGNESGTCTDGDSLINYLQIPDDAVRTCLLVALIWMVVSRGIAAALYVHVVTSRSLETH
eukprot:TRINITY_DN1212_c4_g1_i1.p1 TRINITY_DN1212_c4_g1~~TRINITY_DN1212_c4_g1_i1.p1  ORF type:complete len:708 (+),score=155.69 TRINITY_DN1212_c4_g1_i1:473-2596(+)